MRTPAVQSGCMLRRRVFTVVSALSLLVCGATLLLWVVSYRRILTADRFRHVTRRDMNWSQFAGKVGAFSLMILRGRCEVNVELDSAYLYDDSRWHFSQAPTFAGIGEIEVPFNNSLSNPFWPGRRTPIHRVYFDHASFSFYRNDVIYRNYCLIFPLWCIVLLTAIPPAAWAWLRFKSRRRAMRGFCRSCGCDLRASTDRCPECGMPITSQSGANA